MCYSAVFIRFTENILDVDILEQSSTQRLEIQTKSFKFKLLTFGQYFYQFGFCNASERQEALPYSIFSASSSFDIFSNNIK